MKQIHAEANFWAGYDFAPSAVHAFRPMDVGKNENGFRVCCWQTLLKIAQGGLAGVVAIKKNHVGAVLCQKLGQEGIEIADEGANAELNLVKILLGYGCGLRTAFDGGDGGVTLGRSHIHGGDAH